MTSSVTGLVPHVDPVAPFGSEIVRTNQEQDDFRVGNMGFDLVCKLIPGRNSPVVPIVHQPLPAQWRKVGSSWRSDSRSLLEQE